MASRLRGLWASWGLTWSPCPASIHGFQPQPPSWVSIPGFQTQPLSQAPSPASKPQPPNPSLHPRPPPQSFISSLQPLPPSQASIPSLYPRPLSPASKPQPPASAFNSSFQPQPPSPVSKLSLYPKPPSPACTSSFQPQPQAPKRSPPPPQPSSTSPRPLPSPSPPQPPASQRGFSPSGVFPIHHRGRALTDRGAGARLCLLTSACGTGSSWGGGCRCTSGPATNPFLHPKPRATFARGASHLHPTITGASFSPVPTEPGSGDTVPVTGTGLELRAGAVLLGPTWQASSPPCGGLSGTMETAQTVPPSSGEAP